MKKDLTTNISLKKEENNVDKAKVKKAVKRAMKEIMKENCNSGIFEDDLFALADCIRGEEVNLLEECSFVKEQFSRAECQELHKRLVKKVCKQLQKKQSFLVTARLVQAFESLTGTTKNIPTGKRVKLCHTFVDAYLVAGHKLQEAFEFLSDLEKSKSY